MVCVPFILALGMGTAGGGVRTAATEHIIHTPPSSREALHFQTHSVLE